MFVYYRNRLSTLVELISGRLINNLNDLSLMEQLHKNICLIFTV